jgi:hypothetical protein
MEGDPLAAGFWLSAKPPCGGVVSPLVWLWLNAEC